MSHEHESREPRGRAVGAGVGSGVTTDPLPVDPSDRCEGCGGGIGPYVEHAPTCHVYAPGWRDAIAVAVGASSSVEVEAAERGQVGFSFAPERKAAASQWHTPPKLADRLVSLLPLRRVLVDDCERPIRPDVVLDLGGGGGALTDAVLRASSSACVIVVERDPEWVRYLRDRYARNKGRVQVIEADVDDLASMDSASSRLLPVTPSIVVSNPPFEGGGFARFALAALALARRGAPCAFVIRLVDLATVQSLAVWGAVEVEDLAICSRRPRFGGAVDGGAKEDFACVRFSEVASQGETHHGARVHFWPEAWS